MRSHPLRSSVAERRRRAGSRRSQSGTKETGSREQDASTRHTSGEAWQKQATADSGLSQVVARKEERGRQVPTAANRAVPHVQGPRSRKMVTWMVGHSFIHWVVKYVEWQICGRSLGLLSCYHKVVWWGKSGMRWGNLLPFLTSMMPNWGCPDMLILHLGENDLVKLSGLTLLQHMQRDLELICQKMHGTCVVWTEFVPRRKWRGAVKHGAIERAQRKLNRAMRVFCWAHGIKVLKHEDITEGDAGLYRANGVHLSELGNAYYLMEMHLIMGDLWSEKMWLKEVV
ncbi:uncharacterized protein [Pleurodeles waltl]|uniref:uncharacterized protein n=1 Tax=Pleurodeles waltl TaxID=8319 RepID=UPI003709BF10